MSGLERVRPLLKRGAELVSVALLTAMFGAFLLQVFTRYVLNAPLGWTVEACVVLYLWTVFWTAAFLLRERDHVAFTMLFDAVPPPARRVMAIAAVGLVGLAFAAALPAIVDYVAFMRIDSTPVMRIRFDLVYAIFPLFAAAVVLRAALSLRRLLGAGWRRETGDHDETPAAPIA